MASIGRTAGFCCCRRSPAFHALQKSTGRAVCSTQRGFRTISSSSSSFAALKSLSSLSSLSSWLASSSSSSKGRGEVFAARRILSRTPFNVCAVAGRAYYAEGGEGSSGGRRSSTAAAAAQGAYEQYGQGQGQGQQQQQPVRAQLPRPIEIQWEKDLANAVQLIGNVGRDIEVKYLDSGKVVATTSLAVNKSSNRNEEPSWFAIEIWDALAEIAAHHIKKGEQIFVTGRIVVEKWVKDDVEKTRAKVLVNDLCYVEPYGGSRQVYGSDESVVMGSNIQYVGPNMGSSQRSWNQQQLANQPLQGTTGQKAPLKNYDDATLATEKGWQEYFADPTQWWDNRQGKKNPKAPDFKHKSTQEVLWIDSWRNPPWVSKQLAVLEEKRAQHTGDFVDPRQRPQEKKLSSFKNSDFMY